MYSNKIMEEIYNPPNYGVIKGASGVAAVLSLSAFDAKAIGRNRIGFAEMSAEMPYFKNKMDLNEKLRQIGLNSVKSDIEELLK